MARLILAAMFIGAPMHAQRAPKLEVTPPSSASDAGAMVTSLNLFAEPDMRDLVRSSFPASLRFRLELWREGRLFHDLEGQFQWDLIIQYDPTSERYHLIRRLNGKLEDLGSFATLATAQMVLETPMKTTLVPERAGARYYYTIALDIEALSVSDMDQLARWLRGVRSGPAPSAVSSGLRTLILRMLGGEKRRYRDKSPTFLWDK
ncbi:MAG: hypothetical protein JWM95_797 [Gemmatimonadetes bacterium]|nr:hypothetical protein [Gemmatimonadota bacterium]